MFEKKKIKIKIIIKIIFINCLCNLQIFLGRWSHWVGYPWFALQATLQPHKPWGCILRHPWVDVLIVSFLIPYPFLVASAIKHAKNHPHTSTTAGSWVLNPCNKQSLSHAPLPFTVKAVALGTLFTSSSKGLLPSIIRKHVKIYIKYRYEVDKVDLMVVSLGVV